MGSYIELNDTLQISKAQGFSGFLEIEKHKEEPYTFDDVKEWFLSFMTRKRFVRTSNHRCEIFLLKI